MMQTFPISNCRKEPILLQVLFLVLCNFLKIKTTFLEKLIITDFQQISTLVPNLIMQDSVLERVINCSLCD
jgi:hypothetical protein